VNSYDPAEGDDHPAKRAFAKFYRETFSPLTAYLIVSGAPAQIAPDVAQDCMIELFKRWNSVQQPRPYIYKVAGRMWGRRNGNAQIETPVDELPEPTSLIPRPDALAELEARHDMFRILRELSPRQAQVLFLHLQGFTSDEIGELLGLGSGTVRHHLMKARRAAADRIEEEREGEGDEGEGDEEREEEEL
jgi:RNA polymerase sigma-70 factor (ECF subfamily)